MSMDPIILYQTDLNQFAEPNVAVRRNACKRVLERLRDPTEDTFSVVTVDRETRRKGLLLLMKSAVKLFEDKSDLCRENSAAIVKELMPRFAAMGDADVLDWVLPSIVARIGLEQVVETAEEVRLSLLELATQALKVFKNDIGPRNYIDFYQVLLENCLKDASPEIKRAACECCTALCEAEPKRVKHVCLHLAKVMKNTCIVHKHGALRAVAVSTMASLIAHGAAEILSDMSTEQDNRTTVYVLMTLANDSFDAVRLAVVGLLGVCLLDILERHDQHRRLMPHLLLLLSDRLEQVRLAANTVLLNMGKAYIMDNEDNRINPETRRINIKDIEFYDDDRYPDMTLHCPTQIPFSAELKARPSLGARFVVAEVVRSYLDKIISDITSTVDWNIPHSTVNRRVAALHILAISIFFCEINIVQSTQQILQTLYKGLKDDNVDVRRESLVCVEILGKFLTPSQFLPFIVAQPSKESEMQIEEENRQERSGAKIISITSADSTIDRSAAMPTLLSTAAHSIKSSILLAFQYLLLGSRSTITPEEAMHVVKGLTHKDLIDLESPLLCRNLTDCIKTFVEILAHRGFIATPEKPLNETIRTDVTRRTLDSMLFYTLLTLLGCENDALQQYINNEVIPQISYNITGTPYGVYNLHFGRLVYRHLHDMQVSVFASLLLHSTDIQPYTSQVTQIFLAQLSNVNLTLRVTNELAFFQTLDRLMWDGKVIFAREEFESLLRSIVLEYGKFRPGGAAQLFRKRAVSTLRGMLTDAHLPTMYSVLEYDHAHSNKDPYTQEPKESPSPLSEKVVTMWLSALDNTDDVEMRHTCVLLIPVIATLHLSEGAANEVVQHILLRFNDTNDLIRLDTCRMLGVLMERLEYDSSKSSTAVGSEEVHMAASSLLRPIHHTLVAEIITKLRDIVSTLLLHMDDIEENVGLKEVIKDVLIVIKHWIPQCSVTTTTTNCNGNTDNGANSTSVLPKHILEELVTKAAKVHHTRSLCEEVLNAA